MAREGRAIFWVSLPLPSSLYLGTPYTLEAAHLALCILLVQCGHLQFRGPGGGRARL